MTAGAAMAAEMAEQPGRLADVLARADEIGGRVREVLPNPLAGTVLIWEAALKVEETTTLFAVGYSAADLRHGPIAVASTGLPVLAFTHPGPAADDMLELIDDLHQRGADVQAAGPVNNAALPWPADAPEVRRPGVCGGPGAASGVRACSPAWPRSGPAVRPAQGNGDLTGLAGCGS